MNTKESQAIALQTSAPSTARGWLESPKFQEQMAKVMANNVPVERMVRVALNAMSKSPLLAQCEPVSFCRAMLDLSAAGLEPDGRRAHLIPFRNNKTGKYEVQLIVDYRGIVELIMRAGAVTAIHADKVCENDEFVVDRGAIVSHKINYRKPRGEAYAYYCLIRMKDGGEKAEVMTKDEVDDIRRRSRASGSGPWVTDYNEMAKKTVFRRASKWVELSSELRRAVEADDEVSEPVNVTPPPSLASILETPAPTPAPQPIEVPVDATAEAPADVAPAAAVEPAKEAPPAKTFSAEERAALLKEVEGLMLDHGVTEAKVMVYVHENKLAREGQDELGALDSAVLAQLVGVVATLAKKKK